MRKTVFKIFITFFAFTFFFTGCYLKRKDSSINEELTSTQTTEQTTVLTTSEAPAPPQNVFNVNDTAEIFNFRVKINNIKRSTKGNHLEPGHEYLNIDLTITNLTGKEVRLSSSNFFLLDSNRQIIKTTSVDNEGHRIHGKLGAGRKATGNVNFMIPKGAKGLQFVFIDNVNHKNEIIFALD